MALRRFLLVAILVLGCSQLALASDDERHGVGLGFVGGNVDSSSFANEIDFDGWTIYGKGGFTEHWGLLVSVKDMESDESSIDNDYTQFGVHALYRWRPKKTVRPHLKFGLAWTDFKARLGSFTLSDDEGSFSLGGGLEVGKGRYAFFADIDYTEMDFILIEQEIANVTLGVMFRF